MSETKFLAGFGMANITPEDSVPMASYGDDLRRFSEGKFTELEARALAITDSEGQSILMITCDLSWCPAYLGVDVLKNLTGELGIPEKNIILSGAHSHASVSASHDHLPEIVRYHKKFIDGLTEAGRLAWADRKPAKFYIGSAITERMNFVRRYIMDDGSLCGDNAYGTGTTVVAHESQADPELQILKIAREGGKDIMLFNFQCHPHLEGKTKMLSAQLPGWTRMEAEARWDVHAMYWNGGAGNLNSHSRIKPETRTRDPQEWARIMVDYAENALPHLQEAKVAPIRVEDTVYAARVNHMYDPYLDKATQIQQYFRDGHTAGETATFAHELTGGGEMPRINSYYHANRIIANSKAPQTKDVYLRAWSMGEIGAVVLPYEMFDTTCMYIKRNSPVRRTFITGYSYPSYCGYIPSKMGFQNGGYEADNCTFAPGTAEELADQFLQLLEKSRQ